MQGNLAKIMEKEFKKRYGLNVSLKKTKKPHKNMHYEFLQELYGGNETLINEHLEREKRIFEVQEAQRTQTMRLNRLEEFEKTIPNQFKTEFIVTNEYKRYDNKYFKENKDLILIGKIQKGKTRYAIEIARKNIILGGRSVFLPIMECAIWSIQQSQNFISSLKYQNGALVILDDLVEQSFIENEWQRKKVRPIIKTLFSLNIRMIITMNNSIDDVHRVWDDPQKPLGKISERLRDPRFFIHRSVKGNIIPIKGYK